MASIFQYTQEQEMLRKAAKEFVLAEIAPNAVKWDEEDEFQNQLYPKFGELGAAGVFIPEEYGGVGMGHVERSIFLEEIARHSAGIAISLMTHHLPVEAILKFGNEDQKKKYLPGLADGSAIGGLAVTEPGGGSDFAGQICSAEEKDGKWVLNGRKCFITNAGQADTNVVICRTATDEKGRAELTAFIVEKGTPGWNHGRHENKIGLRASATGDVVMNNCVVPAENMLGKRGDGSKIGLGAIGEIGRAGMTAISVGICRACVEDAVKFANERVVGGKPLAKIQAIQLMIADIRVEYEASKMLMVQATSLKDRGIPATPYFGVSKYFSTEAAIRASKKLMDLMGGYGVVNEYAAGRYLRDALCGPASGGTSAIQQLVVAGDTMKNF